MTSEEENESSFTLEEIVAEMEIKIEDNHAHGFIDMEDAMPVSEKNSSGIVEKDTIDNDTNEPNKENISSSGYDQKEIKLPSESLDSSLNIGQGKQTDTESKSIFNRKNNGDVGSVSEGENENNVRDTRYPDRKRRANKKYISEELVTGVRSRSNSIQTNMSYKGNKKRKVVVKSEDAICDEGKLLWQKNQDTPDIPESKPKDLWWDGVGEGQGERLGNICGIRERIKSSRSIRPLFRVLYFQWPPSGIDLVEQILKFNGFPFDETSYEFSKRQNMMKIMLDVTVSHIAEILGLKSGPKKDMINDILNFLLKPHGEKYAKEESDMQPVVMLERIAPVNPSPHKSINKARYGKPLNHFHKIVESIQKAGFSELQRLHILLFGASDKAKTLKSNILAFDGFPFSEGSDDWKQKHFLLSLLAKKNLKEYLNLLCIESSDEDQTSMINNLMHFLAAPTENKFTEPCLHLPPPPVVETEVISSTLVNKSPVRTPVKKPCLPLPPPPPVIETEVISSELVNKSPASVSVKKPHLHLPPPPVIETELTNKSPVSAFVKSERARRSKYFAETEKGCRLLEDFIAPALQNNSFGDRLMWDPDEPHVFLLRWVHKAANAWSEHDAAVFLAWDALKGRPRAKTHEDFVNSKQRLRCALRNLKYIQEVKSEKGYRYYKILEPDSPLTPPPVFETEVISSKLVNKSPVRTPVKSKMAGNSKKRSRKRRKKIKKSNAGKLQSWVKRIAALGDLAHWGDDDDVQNIDPKRQLSVCENL